MRKQTKQSEFSFFELKDFLYKNFKVPHVYYQYVKANYYEGKAASLPYLYFSKPSGFNDCIDRDSFVDDDSLSFVACLCRSTVENIHMWLMYAPHGFRLEFPKKFINSFALKKSSKNCSLLSLVFADGGEKNITQEEFDEMGITIESYSVAYLAKSGKTNCEFVTYSGNNCFGKTKLAVIPDEYRWLFKENLWKDEMEARIVIKIPKKSLIKHGIEPNKIRGAKVSSTNNAGFKAIRSPIMDDSDLHKDYGIDELLMGIKIEDSKFKNTISININNPKTVMNKISKIVGNDVGKFKEFAYEMCGERMPKRNKTGEQL